MKKLLIGIALMTFAKSGLAKTDALLLDVRTEEEWNEKHIEGATLIDIKKDDFKEKVSKLDKSKTYDVYCRSGNRSGSAVKLMKEMGFQNARNAGSLEDALKSTKGKSQGPGCSK